VGTGTDIDIPAVASLSDIDISVKQFPINLEKALTFTSSRGYSIVFPSSNIAYEAVNVREDLGLPGVNCSSQMDVVKFSDKELLHEDPKISIYTCSIKGTLNNLGNTLIQKTAESGTEFIIQIVD
jgi:predicted mannosyl-3-phosphoglycerate phosphatase (HAD superfamily)